MIRVLKEGERWRKTPFPDYFGRSNRPSEVEIQIIQAEEGCTYRQARRIAAARTKAARRELGER